MKENKRRWAIITAALLLVGLGWLATTDHPSIWPARNVLLYRGLRWWWGLAGEPAVAGRGTLTGQVLDPQGRPIAGAWLAVSEWNAALHAGRTDAQGQVTLTGIPAGVYRAVSAAPGYESAVSGRVAIRRQQTSTVTITLPPAVRRTVAPSHNLILGEPTRLTCDQPIASTAVRRTVQFDNAGRPNQTTLYYLPDLPESQLPLLLTIYPGPAELWECASLPLAEAGYAVLAIGPAYTFNLEADVDELERLVMFARQGRFPGGSGRCIAVLGGSYSGLHVLRLLERDPAFRAALLLGPPSDLFDLRHRLEMGTYHPPYGLDQALIALGLPHREPLRYWQYSGAYHVRPDFPPLALLHSRSDEVVPYRQSEFLAERLVEAGVVVETHFFDQASHYLMDQQGNAPEVYQLALDFLGRTMGGCE
ncbi:MAG: hypothetical protein D6784_08095 [Chloroflexi bacterium]|nr:MAG: hypothetical protein D6784_08095 [Chloroflexota bacterium]